jgi:hypothetical protein
VTDIFPASHHLSPVLETAPYRGRHPGISCHPHWFSTTTLSYRWCGDAAGLSSCRASKADISANGGICSWVGLWDRTHTFIGDWVDTLCLLKRAIEGCDDPINKCLPNRPYSSINIAAFEFRILRTDILRISLSWKELPTSRLSRFSASHPLSIGAAKVGSPPHSRYSRLQCRRMLIKLKLNFI